MEPSLKRQKCPHCGAEGNLHSYNATKYIKLLGLAVFPLASVRIEDECSFCGWRTITPVRDWQSRREKEMELRCEDLGSEAGVVAYLRAVQRYHDREDFFDEAPDLAERFADNPRVMAHISETLSIFREFDQAEAGFQRALEQSDTAEIRGLYAIHRLRRESPRDLEGQLSTEAELYLLVESYQSRGAFNAAQKVLGQIASRWPEQAASPEYKWYLRRNQRKTKTSPAFDLARPARPFLAEPIILTMLIPFVLTFGILTAQAARNRDIDLVNGSDAAYDLEFAGSTHRLVPGQVETVHLPEGEYAYKSTTPGAPVNPGKVKIECFWAARISDHRHFVLNPDGLAIFLSERQIYSKDEVKDFDPKFQLYLGQEFYEFPKLDHFFEPFPTSITVMEEHLASLFPHTYIRSRLDLVRGKVQSKAGTLEKESDRVSYLRTCLDRVPTLDLVNLAEESLADSTLLELARERMERSPTQTIWHMIYQDLSWKEHDLVAEYRQRLSRAPQDAELQFLLGRVSGQMQGDGPFQRLWRARQQMAMGKFEGEAALTPQLPLHFADYCQELLAQGRFQELLDLNLSPIFKLTALVQAGRLTEAEKLAEGEEFLTAMLHYARQQPTGLDLLDGRVKGAAPTTWQLGLAVYLLSRDKQQQAQELSKAIQRLEKCPPFSPEFQASKILAARGPLRTALELNMEPADKRLVLATLMSLDNSHRQAYRELLKKLNYSRDFPYWAIQTLL